jgi:DNA-directed RNA polymerase specialized sigma24 family protein
MKDECVVELYRSCLAGNRDDRAWAALVSRFQPRLRARIKRTLRRFDQRATPELVDDLVQDVYCRILERTAAGFRGETEGQVLSYLLRVCDSVVVDRKRGRATYKRGGRARFLDLDASAHVIAEVLADGGASPEQLCLDRELRSLLLDGCRRHHHGPYLDRNLAIFELAVLDGWTSREIAAGFDWGLKVGSIDSVVHRQRRRLKRSGLDAPPR